MNEPYQIPKRKRIPYGMMNFVDVRERDCYFVDKTSFIPALEASNMFFFFIRPRRFGKSLTLTMLQHYYDVLDRDNFEKWYGGLYIGQHPTPRSETLIWLSVWILPRYWRTSIITVLRWMPIATRNSEVFAGAMRSICPTA